MTVETKYDKSHHAGGTPEARIGSRLRNSGDPRADHHAVHGSGPLRTHTNIHHAGHVYSKETAIQSNDGQTQRGYDSATHQTTSYTPQDKD
jgi:hypothetical protein